MCDNEVNEEENKERKNLAIKGNEKGRVRGDPITRI